MDRVLETTDLRRIFRGRRGVTEAVGGIALEVNEGEIFGFLGPNGAGKTTTLRMLTTVLPPSSGTAMVAGFDLVREANRVRDHVGYVSQSGGPDPTLSGREELIFQGRLYRMSAAEAE